MENRGTVSTDVVHFLRTRHDCCSHSTVMTSPGSRGFVIAGSEDGGSVVSLRVYARVVYFHFYTYGKHIFSRVVFSLSCELSYKYFEMF